ncbi:uncharacterized protein V1518DRAFT_241944 [Limtongia smithiae]|uniref:uncharacterized protein n=1 Tax=Limtongia smithiae TaxID=1125753 RepID=UPI0034CDB9FA
MDFTAATATTAALPALGRANSLRATSGTRVYKLKLVDRVNSLSALPSTSNYGIAPDLISTPPSPERPTPTSTSTFPRERRRNAAFRLPLAVSKSEPKAPTPVPLPVIDSVAEEVAAIADVDLFVAPQPPPIPAAAIDAAAVDDDATDILTLLAAKERRVVEIRGELAMAEDEVNKLRAQYAALQNRSRAPAPTAASTRPARLSMDLKNAPVWFQSALGPALAAQQPSSSVAASSAFAVMPVLTATPAMALGDPPRGIPGSTSSTSSASSTFSAASSASSNTTTASSTETKRLSGGNGIGRFLSVPFPFPSPPRTAPSGRPFAPPRSSSLNETESPNSRASGDDDRRVLPAADDFDYDDAEAALAANMPIRAEEVIHMGKKLAEGLNSHFWNFYEDLKQAAIGDEIASVRPGSGSGGEFDQQQPRSMSNTARASQGIEWRHTRTSTQSSREEDDLEYDDDEYDDDEMPLPPVRSISSFMNSPVNPEFDLDNAQRRGSPMRRSLSGQSSHLSGDGRGHNINVTHSRNSSEDVSSAYTGYNVLRATPADMSSASLIDLASSDSDESIAAPPQGSPRRRVETAASKRYSVYGPTFEATRGPLLL